MKLLLQMTYEDGTICQFPAGGPIEVNFIESVVHEVLNRGVTFKTTAHIENDLRQGLEKALYDFKTNSLVIVTRK